MHPGGLRLTDRAARLAGIFPGARALDLGCGDGATASLLTEKFSAEVTGVDLTARGGDFVRADIAALPFEDDSFDFVFLECVLSVTDDPARVLSEARRVLRGGGKLILSDVYAKTPGGAPWDGDTLRRLVADAGFSLALSEDHTPALVTFAAEQLRGAAWLGYILVIGTRDFSAG
jgi:ubiquinone/menaquinone biosynthesis C-methylase UbiE